MQLCLPNKASTALVLPTAPVLAPATAPATVPAALVAGLATVVLTAGASRLRRVHRDAAVALVFPVLFALGIIGISTEGKAAHLDLDCVLFGNLLGVTDASLWMSR